MENKANGIAVASLVLGIVSIVFSWIWFLALPAGIVAIVLGVKARKLGGPKAGMATAGLVMGIIGTVLGGIVAICAVACAAAIADINSNINNW